MIQPLLMNFKDFFFTVTNLTHENMQDARNSDFVVVYIESIVQHAEYL